MTADDHEIAQPHGLPAECPPTCIKARLQSDSADVGLSPRTFWGFYQLAKALLMEMMKGHVMRNQ
jgi:hypothetical protein